MAKTVSTPAAAAESLRLRPRMPFLLFQRLTEFFNRREAISKTTTKKVLFVANTDSFIELFCLPYLQYFKRRGYQVHVATGTPKPIKYCDRKIRLDLKRSPYQLIHNFRAVRQLEKALVRNRYEIVHCHTPVGGAVARLAIKRYRNRGGATKIFYTAHGFHFYKGAPLHYWLMFYPVEKYLAKYTDTLITINQEDYARAKRKFSKRCHQIEYVPGVGVDEKKFQKKLSANEKLALRKSLGLKRNDFIISCIGRLDKNKNQGFIIKSMPKILAQNKNCHLLLIGADELNGKYQRLAQKLKVEGNVHFLGFRNDVSELTQISNLIVSASKREGLPVNLAEALYVGAPVVATNCRGNRDLLTLSDTGALVTLSSRTDFVQSILAMRSSHRSKIAADFLASSVKKTMANLYQGRTNTRRITVFQLLYSNSFSGAENVAVTIAKELDKKKYNSYYCCPEGPISEKLKSEKIQYIPLKKFTTHELNAVIKKYNPEIIHAHDFRASLLAVRSKFNGRIIAHLHQNPQWITRINFKTLAFLIASRRIERIIVVSNAVRRQYVFSRLVNSKIMVLSNYIDAKKIIALSKKRCAYKKFDLCFSGRLVPAKNPLNFIEIVKYCTYSSPDISACMLGDGELRPQCEQRIKELGLEKNIQMLGKVENPYNIMKRCRFLISPSVYDGSPLAAIEATILGIPMINSGVGGLGEIFRGTDLIATDINEYADKISLSNPRLPDVAQFTNKTSWKHKLLTVYEGDNA